MTAQDTEIESALRLALADKLGEERFDLWFGSGTRLLLAGEHLLIQVADQFTLDWVRNHFRCDIEVISSNVLGYSPAVEFRVDSSLKRPRKPPANSTSTGQTSQEVAPSDSTQEQTAPRRRFARLDRFVVSDGNRVARTAAEMVSGQLGAVTPLFIHGPHGVGKTHLLEGIWSVVRCRSRTARIVYLSAEQFTSYFLEALQGSGLPSFRRKYRGVELLIIDDVQFFAGKRATMVELLHTTDTLLRDGRQLVFAADRAPADLTGLGSDLTGRMSGGLVCRIEPPEQPARAEIARQMAQQCEVRLPDAVLQYLATHFNGDAREIRGAVNRLKATSQALQQPITLLLAEQSLAEMICTSSQVVRLGDIERAVCDVFGLEPRSLKSDRKTKSISHPRMLAMWLARKHTRAALTEISHHFGRRSHSTVISAQKKVERWMARGTPVVLADRTWKLEDAIRAVETRLRAG